jgi:HD-GYP domain-containing protein (c-di-GMP phosphodiesterase class II)
MVAVTGDSVRIDDAWEDPRFDRSVDSRTGYRSRSMLCVPLSRPASGGRSETVGVIQVINKLNGVFDAEDQSLLEAVAGPLAIALENARLFAESEKQFFGMVEAMTASIEVHDGDKLGHSDRTVERALAIGRALGLSHDDLVLLKVASALHDYGMIGVEEAIIHKPGPLDADERAVVQRHAMLTEQLLRRIPLARKYRQVPQIAAAHHEAMDGTGYPHGLIGQEIPFLARIIAVADAYEAMIADRPYRKAQTSHAAWELVQKESGRRFDPVVVSALKQTFAQS